MDEYLKPNASFLRLKKEYEQYGSLVIAFDFASYRADYHWQKMKTNRSDEFYKWLSDFKKEWKELIHQIKR